MSEARLNIQTRKLWPNYIFLPVIWLLMQPFSLPASNSELSFDFYTQEDGLPNNQVQCVFQDSRGWIWIGTNQGLSRFDGYNFVNFLPDPAQENSLKGNIVRVIREDQRGNLLVGTENGGLNIFNRETEQFTYPERSFSISSYQNISVNDIVSDGNGGFFLGTDFGVFRFDPVEMVIRPASFYVSEKDDFSNVFVRNLEIDQTGVLWIGTNDGLYFSAPDSDQVTCFSLPVDMNQNREIWELFLDDEGFLWVGTYTSGLYLISPENRSVQSIALEPVFPRTETVRSVSKGIFGEYWIGTRGGLYGYSKLHGITGYYRHDDRDPRSISNNSVLSIYNDARGETWIGTRGGLNLLAKSKQVFHHYGAMPDNRAYLNSGIVYAIWIDPQERIWIGTEDGGINILDQKTGMYEYLMADPKHPNSITQNCIKAFEPDTEGRLWVGTFLGGINRIDLKSRQITHFKHHPDDPGSLSDNRVWDFCTDRLNALWIATSGGVDRYDPAQNQFEHFPQLAGREQVSWIETDSKGNLWLGSLSEVIVFNPETEVVLRYPELSRSMYEDSRNRIWVATMDKGLALYLAESGPVRYFNEKDGLANNQALCVLEDQSHNLWISTTNGLSRFDPDKIVFQNFTSKDGLSNNQFCYGAAYQAESGKMLFGTVSGFNMFDPREVREEIAEVPMVLTDLKIFNKRVPIGEGKKPVLSKAISETSHVVLKYDQNMFTVEFAALNYVNSDKNQYTYTLEGFNRNWNEPGLSRSATFTNLNPGDYLLRIRRVIPGASDTGNELQLKITILPPFWKSTWFLTLLFLFILFIIYLLVRFFINREKIKNQLIIERVNARKLHELDMMKLKFFTNISHEIRTPLTLIIGPLEKIIKQDLPKDDIKENLKLVSRNARNLETLISQLLDFRKLETGNLKLNLSDGDMVEFVRNLTASFHDLSVEKEIKLSFNTLKKQLLTSFDADKIEKIVNNLLSNSFKFTDAGGLISVNISLVFDTEDDDFSSEGKEKRFIEISVRDTGRGISPGNLNKIFQRFFQSNDEARNSGTGIGLALVKELVEIHNGKIFVTSKPGKGTKFTIRIPYIPLSPEKQTPELESNSLRKGTGSGLSEKEVVNGDLHSKIMLIVEDNADVRQFIASHFNNSFTIVEARNGEEGWKMALEIVPDIMITDVIMPNMNGYELCKLIKNDERTSHIPVLLLTALHSKDDEIKGLTTGADDYITKPFDLSVLQVKVENVLSIRASLHEKFSRTVVLEPSNVVITSPDERFLQKAIEVVENNISDGDLDIEGFADKVGVSRMQLYRKLHALTNMTVKEFIRSIRIKRAAQLLLQKKLNISEIAYAVGFKEPSHFRKCFKREYGMSATEFVAKQLQEKNR